MRRFSDEVVLHSQQRHPNIVQLMGVYYPPRSRLPMLIMEYLPFSLTQCLEKEELPLQVKYSILLDVAKGLCYLHGKRPPIVHRDLTANNVLLTSSYTAKISDLGVSRLADMFKKQQLTTAPCFIPPEALKDKPVYDHKLDVFSYGCLIIHVLTGQFPEPTNQFIPGKDESYRKVPEWDRRLKYIQQIPKENELLPLAKQCLNDDPTGRPEMIATLPIVKNAIANEVEDTMTRFNEILHGGNMSWQQAIEFVRTINDKEEIEKLIKAIQKQSEDEKQELIACTRQEENFQDTKKESLSQELQEATTLLQQVQISPEKCNEQLQKEVYQLQSELKEEGRLVSLRDKEQQEREQQLQTNQATLALQLQEANTLLQQAEKYKEELNKELKEERQLSSSLVKQIGKQVTASEKDEIIESLKTKLDNEKKEEKKLRKDLQEEIESLQQQLQQVKDHKEVGVQFDYLIPQSGMCVCTGSRYDVSVLFQI